MSVRCKHVQHALAAGSAEELGADALLQKHLRDCDECSGLRAALELVDDSLAALPPLEPEPALVDRVLAQVGSDVPPVQLVQSDDNEPTSPAPIRGAQMGRALAMGAAFAAAAAVALVSAKGLLTSDQPPTSDSRNMTVDTLSSDPRAVTFDNGDIAGLVVIDGSGSLEGKGKLGKNQKVFGEKLPESPRFQSAQEPPDEGEREGQGGEASTGEERGPVAMGPRVPEIAAGRHSVTVRSSPVGGGVKLDEQTVRRDYTENIPVPPRAFESRLKEAITTKGKKGEDGERDGRADKWGELKVTVDQSQYYYWSKEKETGGKRDPSHRQPVAIAGKKANELTQSAAQANSEFKKEESKTPDTGVVVSLPTKASAAQSSRARAFVAERSKHAGVPTVSANGFWSNNYIPGDPRLRLLAARLVQDPSAKQIGALDASVAPYPQSFDAPKNSALAVSVRSDRRASDGPARMLLQVGLFGTARQAVGRPALNIGVVLDLAGATTGETATAMRGLLSELRAAKRRGDRFSLTVANHPGGLVLAPDQFRHGPLRVAMQTLFSKRPSRRPASQTLGLAEAVGVATAQVAAADDASGPLGRSMVVVVTAATAPNAVDRRLEGLAHLNATQGIGLSAVGVGTAIDDGQLLRWAAAGHGNRRLLVRSSDAKKVIGSELASAESVVARAVRVRVKLAPGVKLVEVVGAKRLGTAAAARTREAEKSIDRRVAKARGITSDRERDADGIKVIIPSFSAGDSHVILLDVIADGPGALADVSVTYKDLVHMRNGSAKSSLSLKRGRNVAGHLERGVFQNYLGLVISNRLANAGSLLAKSDSSGAARVVGELSDLLRGLRVERPWLRKAVAFERDVATVAKFHSVLRSGVPDTATAYVANSLSYAAWRKIVRVRREAN